MRAKKTRSPLARASRGTLRTMRSAAVTIGAWADDLAAGATVVDHWPAGMDEVLWAVKFEGRALERLSRRADWPAIEARHRAAVREHLGLPPVTAARRPLAAAA